METRSISPQPNPPGGPRLSFWALLDLEYRVFLMGWSNDVKRRLLAARREELALQQQNERLAAGALWSADVAGAPLALPAATGRWEDEE